MLSSGARRLTGRAAPPCGSDCTTPQPVPFTLAPAASFCVAVLFTSGAPATFTDTLRVTYDDPINFDVHLTGASAAPVAFRQTLLR